MALTGATAPRLSILIVTLGRASLPRTLESIRHQLGADDEVLVIGKGDGIRHEAESRGPQFRYVEDGPFGNCGQRELQTAIETQARGTHIAIIGDDDIYLEGALATIRQRISETPDAPHMFRMLASPSNCTTTVEPYVLWENAEIRFGNVGGQMFVFPNEPERIGQYQMVYWGDLVFMESTLAKYPPNSLRWNKDVIIACREWCEKPKTEIEAHIRAAESRVSKTPRKFLCVCEGGTNRSVGLAYTLKARFGQDALAVSWRWNSSETISALCNWADYVVVMESHFAEKLAEKMSPALRDAVQGKLVVVDVGPDGFGAPLHPDLLSITYHAASRWREMNWQIAGDTSSYRPREKNPEPVGVPS